MYEELVKRLKEKAEKFDYDGWTETASDYERAIAAIEDLSAKATPKRVGFNGWKGCRNTRYTCPFCKKYVRNDEKYCHKCGQSLMFPIISHTPYEPGKRQQVIISWPDELIKKE